MAFLLISCESALFCGDKDAQKVVKEFNVLPFDKITTFENVELILKEGKKTKVAVKARKEDFSTVKVEVKDSTLKVKQTNDCISARVKLYVTAPNITELRNASLLPISSEGVLHYPKLVLYSEDYIILDILNSGNFHLNIDSQNLTVISNRASSFYISGEVDYLSVQFYAGLGRFEGENLLADEVSIFHRGNNDIIVNPQKNIYGDLYGTGDLICTQKPPQTNLKCHYRGKVIYKN